MNGTQITGSGWTAADIPDQSGRTAVITGGGAGVGLEAAKALAANGATVVLAGRHESRTARAAAEIPTADVRVVHLDLASLASVRHAANEIRSTTDRLDLLINNAGVMDVPYRRTEDGFELTLATYHSATSR